MAGFVDQAGEQAADRDPLGRSSIAERVADLLRTRIGEGFYPPGERMREDGISRELGISRNTLREAFRLLTHERLLAHELNRGVFVRRPSAADVADIYRVRRMVECAALRALGEPPYDVAGLEGAVVDGERAVAREDWNALGAANFHFHRELVALAGSPRTNQTMRTVLAELRLAFYAHSDLRALHAPYLGRNRELTQALARGETAEAERLLVEYLDDSSAQLTAALGELGGTEEKEPA
ncbi:GntR family transcriptional regulator [Streptomyces sp. NPDC058045]|uniref:GntR family transcriptional regulator n=1 Tax=Streptomyces sp. NPDC058045 TaxID=3346311 RepID=UPI0036E3FD55